MKEKALAAFKAYTDHYDSSNVNIKLKIDHTYRVASIATRIARSLELEPMMINFSWLLGLLHDIGRFEQYKRYQTFVDRNSVDHAELGADILFNPTSGTPLIQSFIDPEDWLDPEDTDFDGWEELSDICETAIRLHNKLNLPDLDEGTLLYTDLLRDADKADIQYVLLNPPYDERNRHIIEGSKDGSIGPASDEVMSYVRSHRCVPKKLATTDFENLISQCCMGFELVYPESIRIVKSQGYLDTLMNLEVADPVMASQLEILRNEMQKAWG